MKTILFFTILAFSFSQSQASIVDTILDTLAGSTAEDRLKKAEKIQEKRALQLRPLTTKPIGNYNLTSSHKKHQDYSYYETPVNFLKKDIKSLEKFSLGLNKQQKNIKKIQSDLEKEHLQIKKANEVAKKPLNKELLIKEELKNFNLQIRALKLDGKFQKMSGDIKGQMNKIERLYDQTNMGAYVKEKLLKLMNSKSLCEAAKKCSNGSLTPGLNKKYITNELYPQNKNTHYKREHTTKQSNAID